MGATTHGVNAWKNGLQRQLTIRNGLPCNNVQALIFDNHGTLWLYAQCGLVSIERAELQKWWDSPNAILKVKVLDALDGVQPGHAPFNLTGKSPDGKLWFAGGTFLQMVDPDLVRQDVSFPPVHIEEVVANHVRYPLGGTVSLPPASRDLEIAYTAPSFG